MKRTFFFGGAGAFGLFWLTLLLPGPAFAHGFGDRYDLPVPLGLYMSAGGAAVVLSFVVVGLFAKRDFKDTYPQKNLRHWTVVRMLTHPVFLGVVRALSAFVFVVYLVAGLFGTQDPNQNLVPTMTWVVFWVGAAYVSALAGDIWMLLSPQKIIFGYAESLIWKVTGKDLARYEPYPTRLSAWPAVLLFLAFAWVEIVYTGSGVPLNVATLVLVYSSVTFIGMWWFGRDEWLRNGEVFTIAFGFLAAFAPIHCTDPADDDGSTDHGFSLRPWGAGLLTMAQPELPRAILLVLMLAVVSFDGFVETGTWTELLLDLFPVFSFLGAYAFSGITTLGLIVAPFVFFGVFALTAWLMGWLVKSSLSTTELVCTFVFSLVPIALAYHIAHFFSFLVIQGQRMFSLASDPFGWGWDLFGTSDYAIDIGVVNARFIWFLSIAAIVIGHIVAVYVAYVYALRTFGKGTAMFSQAPMLALMAGYTMVSLWIVAQPIVEI
jgi:hypothetical protein